MVQKLKAFIKTFLGIPLTIISLFFIFKIIINYKLIILENIININKFTLIIGIILLVLYFLMRGLIWQKLLKKTGYSIDTHNSLYAYQLSEIKRYTPGNIFSFLARIVSFENLKIPKNITLKLIFIEMIILVISSAIVSIPSFSFVEKIIASYFDFKYIFLTAALFCIGIIFVFIISKKKKISFKPSFIIKYADILILSVISWTLFGLGNYFIAASLVYIDPNTFLQTTSFFVLSWLLGYLSFVAPMGLGVREAIITLGLSSIFPIYIASSISIISRVILIISEFIYTSILLLIKKIKLFQTVSTKLQTNFHIATLFLLIISYISYFTFISFEKHANFFTGRFDLGNMDQTVWNTINGKIFMLTNPDNVNIISRLAIHADFILILLSPLYLIWADPRMLLFVQSLILGLGGLFIYLISINVLKDKNLSLVFAFSYLLNPFLQKQNLYDFHSITLATTFLLASFYFLQKSKYLLFLIFIVLSVLTKENVYLVAFFFGIYIIYFKKQKWGAILSSISIVIFYLLIAKFIPEARGGNHFALEYFNDFGNSPGQIAKNFIFQPQKSFQLMFAMENFEYIKKTFLSVGFISLLSPLYLIFSIQDFAINLLSKNSNFKSINFHYAAIIIPYVYISAIYGTRKVLDFNFKYISKNVILIYLLFFSLYSTWSYGVLPGSKNPSLEIFTNNLAERDEIKKFISKIPSNLSVASTNNLGSHLSHREYIYTIPKGLNDADVVLFLLNDEFAQPSLKEQVKMVESLRNNKSYVEIYNIGPFVAFEKKDKFKF